MVFVTGDTHGDIGRLSAGALKKLSEGDTLIICGDFGFIWDNSKHEQKNLKQLLGRGYDICFIDGAHENFELLNSYPVEDWKNGNVHRIGDNIYHLMRGQVFHIEGQRIFTMGGGESPDIEIRYQNDTWSPAAVPSPEELVEGANNINKSRYEVDIIVTHEPPATLKSLLGMNESEEVQFTVLNTYFDELTKLCRYRKWYFGSMHVDKFISSTQISVFRNILNARTGEI